MTTPRLRRLGSLKELDGLLDRRNRESGPTETIDRLIRNRFLFQVAVLVLDMADFSVSVRRNGIIAHLALIRRMNVLAGKEIVRTGGRVVKFEADNAFAVFPTMEKALEASVAIQGVVAEAGGLMRVSIGLGHGPILLTRDDFFGDAVNMASKLGEDLAGPGEILLTREARKLLKGPRGHFEKLDFHVSGLRLPCFKWIGPVRPTSRKVKSSTGR
ncbi:MAG: adenylate/guanylate cyclase domain-containing protein [Candidatus Methylacidiphilales bacterium]|nr:adenylate/guanylate cyclase domain-containing protein [Candidatus Methylacidiphilales bacterium]